MEPTFSNNQSIVTNKWAYLVSSPKRGDIVYINKDYFSNIKRIIGLPGETIEIKNGELLIDGIRLEEDYISSYISSQVDVKYPVVMGDDEEESLIGGIPPEELKEYISTNINVPGYVEYPVILGAGEYFVLGDNIDCSLDSRFTEYGLVTRDEICGKVLFKTISISNIK